MIRFESPEKLEPVRPDTLQWGAALGAGLIAGGVMLVVPRGSPWSQLTFFSPTVLGRTLPEVWNTSFASAAIIHLALSIIYGFVISLTVKNATQLWSLMSGAISGLALYVANFGIIAGLVPALRGDELSVMFTHVVFGMIAGGAYRGLLKRRLPAPQPPDLGNPSHYSAAHKPH